MLLVGVVLTAALAIGSRSVHDANETRLLRQKAKEVRLVLTSSLASIRTPLVSAAEVAEATAADRTRTGRSLTPLVGPGKPFVSATVWRVPPPTGQPKPIIVIGGNPLLAAQPAAKIRAVLARAADSSELGVTDWLSAPSPRVGYAITATNRPVNYVVYAETALPAHRTAVLQPDSAFFGLGYALYLGHDQRPQDLLAASTAHLPLHGREADIDIPFGGNNLHLELVATRELGGTLLARLPWILTVSGLVLAFGAAALTDRLVRQREQARRLAVENANLYATQHSVAQTLQQSLLPETLPDVPGFTFEARYVAGVSGIDVGGDWYDVMCVNGEVFFVVGDVSGRGLRAATVMASLRYATRAYAIQGDQPEAILDKLGDLVDVVADDHFATVLCGLVHTDRREVTLANAAHPAPIIISGDDAEFASTKVGVPIGVPGGAPYASVTIPIPAGATLLAYTDGLVERRHEHLDLGFERLKAAASSARGSLDVRLTEILAKMGTANTADDIAILAVEWQNDT